MSEKGGKSETKNKKIKKKERKTFLSLLFQRKMSEKGKENKTKKKVMRERERKRDQ